MPDLWEACKVLSYSQCECVFSFILHKRDLKTATVVTKQLPMFMLSNYVWQNNLHVKTLNDSIINSKHHILADDN